MRWVQVHDDEFIHNTFHTGVGGVDDYAVVANNSLVGRQIGAATRVWDRNRLLVECLLKSGIYNNDTRTNIDANEGSSLGGPGAFSHAAAGVDSAAFVGEINLLATYQIRQRLALRAGYQLMWIDGVAMANDQIPNTTLFMFDNNGEPVAVASPSTALSRNTMFLKGANVALELSF